MCAVQESQTAFALHCVDWLHNRMHERRVILVGHSYGGVVATSVIARLENRQVIVIELVLLTL